MPHYEIEVYTGRDCEKALFVQGDARAQVVVRMAEDNGPCVDELLALHVRNDPDDGVLKR
jgi:hypothetical protein